jgi:transcription-repair coupling factor (superfamily II helicase)
MVSSNIGYLLQKYRQSAQVQQLCASLSESQARVRLEGLKGTQRAFVLAATAESMPSLQVAVCETKDEAAYLFNDLTGMLGESRAWFFPDSFKRPTFFDTLNPTQVLQRSETVNKLTSARGNGHVLITYPEAIFERVVKPSVLKQDSIMIAVGESLDVETSIEILIGYGFVRADFVYEPGQFSIRGGIVDLFSYGNDLPYRIELFDDEVESIRTFDPLTQMSKEKLTTVSIIPNLNTRFRQDQKAPVFQILPDDTVLWINDIQFVYDRLQYCFEQAEKFAVTVGMEEDAELREIFRDRSFVYPGDISADLDGMRVVFT